MQHVSTTPQATDLRRQESATRRVVLLRHGEKQGSEVRNQLSSAGRLRAFALPYLLSELSRHDGWPLTPDYLVAASNSPRSERPTQTLWHLSRLMSLPIHQVCTTAAVVDRLLHARHFANWRFSIVVWRRPGLLRLARELGAQASDLPADWPAKLYDRLLVLDLDSYGGVLRTRCVHAPDEAMLSLTPTQSGHRQSAELRAS